VIERERKTYGNMRLDYITSEQKPKRILEGEGTHERIN
jgi:hypothetical protein